MNFATETYKEINIETEQQSSVWRVAAVSVCGTAHERVGMGCQDVCGWRKLPGELIVAAVADGAGSASQGEVGARVAVDAVLDYLVGECGEDDAVVTVGEVEGWMQAVVPIAQESVWREAGERGVAERELATTLIVLAVAPGFVVAAQIGDGATVVQDESGEMTTLTSPNEEGYINETTFITEPDAIAHLHCHVLEREIVAAAAFTDGLQRLALKMPEAAPHIPFFSPLFRFMASQETTDAEAELTALLRSPRITERTDDDLTLLLVTRDTL